MTSFSAAFSRDKPATALQTTVLVIQLLQPLHVGGFQATVPGLSLVVRRGADAVVPPDFVNGPTGIGLFQDRHNLGFGELQLAQGNLLARMTIVPERSPWGGLDLGGAYGFPPTFPNHFELDVALKSSSPTI